MADHQDLSGTDPSAVLRHRMVEHDIRRRRISNNAILEAMREVPRHLFVPAELGLAAYQDRALPIGGGQTISQPYIVARMIELARVGPGARVLDVGTGCGYAAAVVAQIAAEVVTVEIRPELATDASHRLSALGYDNIVVHTGDARQLHLGAFDAILVAAAAATVPPSLESQLAEGGRLVIPVGSRTSQHLWVIERVGRELVRHSHEAVAFVPLIQS